MTARSRFDQVLTVQARLGGPGAPAAIQVPSAQSRWRNDRTRDPVQSKLGPQGRKKFGHPRVPPLLLSRVSRDWAEQARPPTKEMGLEFPAEAWKAARKHEPGRGRPSGHRQVAVDMEWSDDAGRASPCVGRRPPTTLRGRRRIWRRPFDAHHHGRTSSGVWCRQQLKKKPKQSFQKPTVSQHAGNHACNCMGAPLSGTSGQLHRRGERGAATGTCRASRRGGWPGSTPSAPVAR